MSTSIRVLIVEASEENTVLIVRELLRGGYDPTYEQVAAPEALEAALALQPWDLVIANNDIPAFPAQAALKCLKAQGLDLPFIIVSSESDNNSSVSAIKAGAHDYIIRGNLTRLVPAVERELREATVRHLKQQAEESLREREANLFALIENTQDAVWSVDRYYCLVALNSVLKQQFRQAYGVELAIGMNFITAVPEQTQLMWRQYYDRALAGERFSIEQRFELPEQALDVEISFNPIFTDQDKITGVAVFGRNITDRKRVEAEVNQAKDQLQAVLDAVPGCVSWFSSDLKYLGINRYLAATFNLQPEDFIGRSIGFKENSTGFNRLVTEFFHSPVKESAVEVATTVNGEPRSYLIAAQKYAQDEAAVFIGIDITERKQVEEALRETQERYLLAVRGANDGIWDWNLKTNEIYYSPRWKTMLGYTDAEVTNQPDEWFKRIHPDDLEQVRAQLSLHLEGLTRHFESEHRMLHRDGGYLWILTRGIAVRDREGQPTRMAGSQTDVTQRKQVEEQLLHDAFHDTLTNLPNRALFIDRLGQAIERAKRSPNYRFATLFLDLDRFKMVNDSLGHGMGDELLIAFARRLKTCLRPGDTVARLGGDEFVILLEDIQAMGEATRVADHIHQALEYPFNLGGHEVYATASIGIALSDTGYERPEETLRDADTAMYRAKAMGRSCHEVFDREMHARAVALLQLETDLRRAIEREELRLHYQPIVNLQTRKISGFEALVRWQHPERGLVSPGEFIPIAEDTGLIIPIGQWVLEEACRQIRKWQDQFPSEVPLTMSVNLSGKQFLQPNLVEIVDAAMRNTGLMPCCLKLEITETVVMADANAAIAMLEELKALGLQLQIDDFGTGYSSFAYLHRFPTNTLKIDRSFVIRMGTDNDSSEIVRTIVTLAHNLGMTVTAEGVETLEQVVKLQCLQCENGQGYFFSRPVDAEAATALLAAEYVSTPLPDHPLPDIQSEIKLEVSH